MASESTVRVEELLAQSRWLRDLARSLVGDQRADDLAQDALLAALRRPPREGVPVRAWLAGISRKLALSQRRGEANRTARETRAAGEAQARTSATPAELLGQVESQRLLAEALLALEEPFRHTVLQRYFEGRSSAEIARESGEPDGTVRWRLSRALEQLREQLDARHGGDRRAWSVALGAWVGREAVRAPLAGLAPVLAVALPVALALALGAWSLTRSGSGGSAALERASEGQFVTLATAEPALSGAASERLASGRAGTARATAVSAVLVTCRAQDEHGAALAGATLARLADESSPAAGADGELALDLRALESGEMLELVLDAPGRVPRTLVARWRGEAWLALGAQRLVRSAALEGRALLADGAPAAGAEVLVEVLPGRTEIGRPASPALLEWGYLGSMLPAGAPLARADADGRYRFEALAPGYVRLWVRRADFVTAWSEPLALEGGTRVEAIALALRAPEPSELVEGLVVDPLGAPVPGAEVRAWRASRPELAFEDDERTNSGRCDERGRFRLIVNPNPGLELRARDPHGRWSDSVPLRARPGARELALRLRTPERIAVEVTDELGMGVADARVFAVDEASGVELESARTDELGRALLALPGRAFVVEVEAEGFVAARSDGLEARAPAQPLAIALVHAPLAVGRATHAGRPVAGARVELVALAPDGARREIEGLALGARPLACRARSGRPATPAWSAEDGSFALPLAARGPHALRVEAAGLAPVVIELPASLEGTLELELEPAATLAGRVRAHGGAPLEGALVGASDGFGRLRLARADADGRFRIEGLAAAGHEVRLFERDLSLVEERELLLAPAGARERASAGPIAFDVELEAGEESWLELEAEAAGGPLVAGELALDGEPAGPWQLELAHVDAPEVALASGALDPRGRFELALPGPGRYVLRAWLPEPYGPRVVWTDELAVDASGARWQASYQTGSVRPLAGALLAPGAPALELAWRGPGALAVRARVTAQDVERGLELRLPAGVIELRRAGEEAALMTFELAAGERLELALDAPR